MKVGAILIYGIVVFCLALMYMAVKGARDTEGFASGGYEFMMLHMDGCPHCVDAMPDINDMKAKSPMTINGKSVTISEVEGTKTADGKAMSKKYGVDGFPTFILSKPDGSFVKYGGERNAAGYKKFIESNVA